MKKVSLLLAITTALLSLCFLSCTSETANKCVYELDLTYDSGVLDGKMDFTYYNDTDNAISELKFNLFANAYRNGAKYLPVSVANQYKAYYAGKSYGNTVINSVKDSDGDIPFSIGGQDENLLIVPLKSEVYPNEKTKISVDFTVNLAKVNHRLGITENTINLGNFFPVLCAYDDGEGFYECLYYSSGDPFYSACADFKVKLTCSDTYTVASSGKIKSAKTQNGVTVMEYVLDNARDFAFVLSEKFQVISTNENGVEISYYYVSDQTADKSLEYAQKAVQTFGKLFGAYPYETLAVCETGFLEGGMEYPALTYISDSLEKSSYGEVVVHETAHQWWYAAVGNNQIKYGFLDEGLAEYSVVLFYENNSEYGLSRQSMIKSAEMTYQTFCTVYDRLFGLVDSSMLRDLSEYSSEYEYVNIAYIKGCLMFDYLRQTVGEEKFFSGLKKYYAAYAYKIAEPYDIVGVYEKVGADTNGFFDSFYQGKVII